MIHMCNKKNCLYNKAAALCHHLNPVLDRLIQQDPEALPFHYPVDAELLNIPDYHDVIKHPMDLSTIRKKLHSGQYQNGWEFVEDVWLMFENAWLYNKKTSRVYKYCSKLADLFKSIIDDPMKRLGYCCGQNYKFEIKVLFCSFKQDCIIQKGASYWKFEDRYNVCKKCFSRIEGNLVVFQRFDETVSVGKEDFVEKVNDVVKKEPFVKCFNCGIECHTICVLFLEDIWKEGFLCELCLSNLRKEKVPNKFTSENLQETKLGSHIEERVNNFLANNDCSSRVIIRLVYNARKSVQVKNGAKTKYVTTGFWPEEFPYTVKTILAFQKIKCKDVCFFAMFVQEYGSECPQPNSRRVYISYLDSVQFFTPKELRTSVYHEILLGYLDFVKNLGFTRAHLWSCPSKEGEDYVFYCHPKEQKNPSLRKLIDWYKAMLNKGIKEGIVKWYQDMHSQAIDDGIKTASELPYFEGDFLPITLENEILKLEGSEESDSYISKKKTASHLLKEHGDASMNAHLESKVESPATKCRKSKKKLKSPKQYLCSSVDDPLTDKILLFLLRFKEVFLVIHLHLNSSMPGSPPTIDPDLLIPSGMMCSREAYLEYCREKDHEFSSLRRAFYSSMVLLYELHKENIDIVFCNHCGRNLEAGFHCTVCKDFDLCFECYRLNGHYHKMEEQTINSSSESYISIEDKFKLYFVWLEALAHVSSCNNANCQSPQCKKVKRLLQHLKMCKKKNCPSCSICSQLIAQHSKTCKNFSCLIHQCREIQLSSMEKSMDKQFCTGYTSSKALQNIHHQNRKEELSPTFSVENEMQPCDNNYESFTSNDIPESEKERNFTSFLSTYQLKRQSHVAHDQNLKSGTSCVSNHHIKTKNGPGNMDKSKVINASKVKSETGHFQNFSTSYNEIYSYSPENTVDPIQFSGKYNIKMPIKKHCSQSMNPIKVYNSGKDPQDAHLSANLETDNSGSAPFSLSRKNEKSPVFNVPQTSSSFKIINPKIEHLDELSGNVKDTESSKNLNVEHSRKNVEPASYSFLSPNIQNFNSAMLCTSPMKENNGNFVIPGSHQNVSYTVKSNQSPEVSCIDQTFFPLVKLNSSNTSQFMQTFNSNSSFSQLINPKTDGETTVSPKFCTSVNSPEAFSCEKSEKSLVHSDNFINSMLFTNASMQNSESFQHEKVPVFNAFDIVENEKHATSVGETHLSNLQTCSNNSLRNLIEEDKNSFALSTSGSDFLIRSHPETGQMFKIPINKQVTKSVDSPKVTVYNNVKSTEMYSASYTSSFDVFDSSEEILKETEKALENKQQIATPNTKPNILRFKPFKSTNDGKKVSQPASSVGCNSSENVKYIEDFVANVIKETSPSLKLKKIFKVSKNISSELLENVDESKIVIAYKIPKTNCESTNSCLNATSKLNNENFVKSDNKVCSFLARVPKRIKYRRSDDYESHKKVHFESSVQPFSSNVYAITSRNSGNKNCISSVNNSKISDYKNKSETATYPSNTRSTTDYRGKKLPINATSTAAVSKSFATSTPLVQFPSQISSNQHATRFKDKPEVYDFIKIKRCVDYKNGTNLVGNSQTCESNLFSGVANHSNVPVVYTSQSRLANSSTELHLETSTNMNTYAENYKITSMTNNYSTLNLYTCQSSPEIEIVKERKETSISPSMYFVNSDINRNAFHVINSRESSQNATPTGDQYLCYRNKNNQNLVPHDYHLNSAAKEIHQARIFTGKSNEMSTQCADLQNVSSSVKQTFGHNSIRISHLTPICSNNVNASFDAEREMKVKEQNVSAPVAYRNPVTSFNIPLFTVNKSNSFHDLCSNKQDPKNYDTIGNFSVNSSQAMQPSFKAKVFQTIPSKGSHIVCNNYNSELYSIENKVKISSRSHLSFEELAKAHEVAASLQPQHSLPFLNNYSSKISTSVRQNNKKTPMKKAFYNKRTRKGKSGKKSNT